MMGEGLSGFFWRALVAKRLSLPASEAADVYTRFIGAYRQTPARQSRLYPGIPGLLDEIRDVGAYACVCTNKVEDIAIQILVQLGIRDKLYAVVGHRDDRPKKPNPLTLFQAISLAGGSPQRALMVGDTEADSSAAIAAGIPAVLVTYGYSHLPIRAVSTNFHVDTVPELHEQIFRFMAESDKRVQYRAALR
jgi:phosphoglycolate phosphatase